MRQLISNIPRLQEVAEIAYYMRKNFDGAGLPANNVKGEQIPAGARALRIIKDLTHSTSLDSGGKSSDEVLSTMEARDGVYDPAMLQTLSALLKSDTQSPNTQSNDVAQEQLRVEVSVEELCAGQKLLEDIKTLDGMLLVVSGTELSELMVQRIRNYSQQKGVQTPLVVNCLLPVAGL
jgi:hypothetical protein